MQVKPLDLEDKEIIESYFKAAAPLVSDLSFTNLYLWHFGRFIGYCELDCNGEKCLIIKTKYPDEVPFIFYPICKNTALSQKEQKEIRKLAIEQSAAQFRANGIPFSMHSLSEDQVAELKEFFGEDYEIIYRDDRSDYIYSAPELIELKGKKYHKKKTHLNRFNERYEYSYEPLSENNCNELIETYKIWFGKIADVSSGLKNEFTGIIESLRKFSHLSFKGGLLREKSSGKIIAFSFGEMLNPNTVVIHIEKADIEYSGAYQAINQQFLEHEWNSAEIELVNREEDLGIAGLRKAKESYHPLYLQKKFDAILK